MASWFVKIRIFLCTKILAQQINYCCFLEFFAKVEQIESGKKIDKKKTAVKEWEKMIKFEETFAFNVPSKKEVQQDQQFLVTVSRLCSLFSSF